MKLVGDVKIRFGNSTITQQTLDFHESRMRGWVSLPLSEEERMFKSNQEAFRMLLSIVAPFVIVAPNESVVFGSIFKRFCPHNVGRKTIMPFGIRLIPEYGSPFSVDLDQDGKWRVPMNLLSVAPNERVVADLGNGVLRLEIFFRLTRKSDDDLVCPACLFEEVPSKPVLAYT